MMGAEADFLQDATAAVADAALASAAQARLGGIYSTGKRNITVTAVKQGAVELELGTDFDVFYAEGGLIRILPTSPAFVAATAITWSGSAPAIAAGELTAIKGGTQGKIGCKGLFVPRNPEGPKIEVEFYNASLVPNGNISLISADQFLKFSLTGVLQDDSAGNYGGSADNPTHRAFYLG
jgi:hypothetical protein